jgi:hypothetical protein
MTCYVEVPVFADGGWSDVEQIEVPCDEPPDVDDDGWWPDHEVAIIDYDPPFNDARYEGF